MPQKEIRRPSRLPIIASAFFPGSGQLIQRRWRSAAFFGVSFGVTVVAFMGCAVWIIWSGYALAHDFATSEAPVLPLVPAIVAFVAALLVYLAGLVDTYHGYRLACSEWSRQRHGLTDDVLREVLGEDAAGDG